MEREEKIKELTRTLNKQYRDGLSFGCCVRKAIEWARKNAWYSVGELLPTPGQTILVVVDTRITGGGEESRTRAVHIEKYDGKAFCCDRMEQQRMGVYMFDIIVKTTHWAPVPELPLISNKDEAAKV